MLVNIVGRVVDTDGVPMDDGLLRFHRARSGILGGALLNPGTVDREVVAGVMDPLALAPGDYVVWVLPAVPTLATSWKFALPIDGLTPDIDLATVAPAGTVDGELLAKGDKGDQGDPGPFTNITAGPVEKLAPGSAPTAALTGPPGEKVLELGIVTGDKGDKGDPGGIVAGTLLNAADLNTIVSDGVFRQDVGVNATPANNYPSNIVGWLLVTTVTGSGAGAGDLNQTYVPKGSKGPTRYWARSRQAGVWSPWVVYASTRVDNTAGRAIYQWDDTANREQLIYGDTGARDISTILSAGLAKSTSLNTTTPTIRRVGWTVSVELFLDVTSAGLTSVFAIPVGFRGRATVSKPSSFFIDTLSTGRALPAGDLPWYLSQAAVRTVGPIPINSTIMLSATWITQDSWPSNLPGTAFGAIPNL